MIKVMIIVGTRPEAIKMAPVIKVLYKESKYFKTVVVSSGQHRQMLDQVFEIFEIKPDYDLRIMKKNQSLSDISMTILKKLGEIMVVEKPDIILVHGDTPTAMISALTSFYHRIPISHVEAGLRTYEKYNPYPEEMNRQVIDCLADYYFAPTIQAERNLLNEGKNKNKIFVTGNTVIDALHFVADKEYHFNSAFLKRFNFNGKNIILLTSHRRESWGEKMEQMFLAIKDIASQYPDVEVIFPVHLNPLVKASANKILAGKKNIHLLPPLNYQDMVKVMKLCYLVVTDSGGLQEEAPSLGKPTLVLRDTTERPEGLKAGTLKLIGTDRIRIFDGIKQLIEDDALYIKMSRAKNPYGDGKASERIIATLKEIFKDK